MWRRALMCMLSGGALAAAAGCAAERASVTIVTPSYSYLDDANAEPIVWSPPMREERTVAAMLAEAGTADAAARER